MTIYVSVGVSVSAYNGLIHKPVNHKLCTECISFLVQREKKMTYNQYLSNVYIVDLFLAFVVNENKNILHVTKALVTT